MSFIVYVNFCKTKHMRNIQYLSRNIWIYSLLRKSFWVLCCPPNFLKAIFQPVSSSISIFLLHTGRLLLWPCPLLPPGNQMRPSGKEMHRETSSQPRGHLHGYDPDSGQRSREAPSRIPVSTPYRECKMSRWTVGMQDWTDLL